MTFGRQVELRRGSATLSLNDATYILQADNGWQNADTTLTLRILVKASTLTQLERLLLPIERLLTEASWHTERLVGDPVYVCTKTCDDLSTAAEIGATWQRKMVRSGRLTLGPLTGTAAAPSALLTLLLDTDDAWQRISPAPIIEVTTGTATTRASDGAIQTSGAAALYVRRQVWTTNTGLTARILWEYADAGTAQLNFIRVSGNMRCFWTGSSKQFAIGDDAGTYHYSGAYTFTAGQQIEIVARWTTTGLSIVVNGVSAVRQSGSFTLTAPDTYRVWEPDSGAGSQTLLSVQVWPCALTDAQCTGLATWGRPAPELAFCVPPADEKATNGRYPIYNVPGTLPARLRMLLHSTGSQDFTQLWAGLRPLRIPSATKFECESGTLGANTASNSNSAASGGSQARFTPADTSWATRVSLVLAANPTNVTALQGEHRIFLAGFDSAAAVQVNLVRWRLVVAGIADDWSDEMAFAAVSLRSLVNLGTVSIPSGTWPAEALTATTTGYGSSYVTLEVQAKNVTGSGGGTLDMDAVYLAPAEIEGLVSGTFDVSDVDLLVDHTGETPVAIAVQESRSLEFGGWASWVGDDLILPPVAGDAGSLWLFWFRDAAEQAFPNDTCDMWLAYAPRWR